MKAGSNAIKKAAQKEAMQHKNLTRSRLRKYDN